VITITPDITAQLVRAKHVYSVARTLSSKSDAASRVIVTILLDYAAESVLKTVYWSHPTTAPKAKELRFPELLRAVAELAATPSSLPLQNEILNLHTQRNLTQHRNLTPSAEDVSRNGAYVEAFLRDLFNRFFAVDFDSVTLASLVSDAQLRRQLQTAESHLAAGRYREAVEEGATALHNATWMAGDLAGVGRQEPWSQQLIQFSIPHPPVGRYALWTYPTGVDRKEPSTLLRLGPPDGWREFSSAQQELIVQIVEWIQGLTQQFAETLRALTVGGDWAAYMRFRAIAPEVSLDRAPTGKELVSKVVAHRKDDYSEEDARAVFDYALDQILRLEAMGALPAPREEE
jgi:hypothetical protein